MFSTTRKEKLLNQTKSVTMLPVKINQEYQLLEFSFEPTTLITNTNISAKSLPFYLKDNEEKEKYDQKNDVTLKIFTIHLPNDIFHLSLIFKGKKTPKIESGFIKTVEEIEQSIITQGCLGGKTIKERQQRETIEYFCNIDNNPIAEFLKIYENFERIPSFILAYEEAKKTLTTNKVITKTDSEPLETPRIRSSSTGS